MPRNLIRLVPSPYDVAQAKIIGILFCAAGALVLTWGPLSDLVLNGRPADYYKHIPLIPAVSAYVMFRRRRDLFRGEPGSPVLGGTFIAVSLGLLAIDMVRKPRFIGHVEFVVLGAILFFGGELSDTFRQEIVRASALPVPLPRVRGTAPDCVDGARCFCSCRWIYGCHALALQGVRRTLCSGGVHFSTSRRRH